MPKHCVAVGCNNHNIKKDKKLSFYIFPNLEKDSQRRKKWIHAVKRVRSEGRKVTSKRAICLSLLGAFYFLTFRDSCPVQIKVAATKNGIHLEVVSMEVNHNHQCDEVSYNHLPKQRKLDKDSVKEASRMLNMKCDKKILQSHLQSFSGRVVTGRDISNLKSRFSKNKNNIEKIAEKLHQNKGSTTEIVTDADSNLLGIYYQDNAMKFAFEAFPEIIFVDAIYKVNELRMPLYVLLGEDGNGESEIFAVFLVSNEEEVTIRKMVKIFKEVNASWGKTLTIMSDKDFIEREVFGSEFPNANLFICLSRVQTTFRREITANKMGIRREERNLCLEILQKMTYAKTKEEYDHLHLELKSTKFKSVVDYFGDNWHPICEQWVKGLIAPNITFLNRRNNRTESISQKIKTVCSKFSSLDQFFDELLVIIQSRRTARDHKAVNIIQKKLVLRYKDDSPEANYQKALTPYAFNYVKQEINMISKVKTPEETERSAEINSSIGKVTVTDTSCQCTFWTSMQLPCRHILAFRKERGMNLFHSSLCTTRWTMGYYKSKHSVLQSPNSTNVLNDNGTTSISDQPMIKILSQGQKYKKIFNICQKIASLVSEFPMRLFNNKLDVLNQICDSWANGVDISIQPVVYESYSNGNCDGKGVNEEKLLIQPETIELKNDAQMICDVKNECPVDNEQLAGDVCVGWESVEPDPNYGIKKEVCILELSQINTPPKMPKRGHPKGAELTVIGLPNKKAKMS